MVYGLLEIKDGSKNVTHEVECGKIYVKNKRTMKRSKTKKNKK